MKTKSELIADYLAIPIKVGDEIIVKGENYKDLDQESWEDVVKVDSEFVYYRKYGYSELQKRKLTDVRKNPYKIGTNPFQPELRMTSYQTDVEQLFWRGGYEKSNRTERNEKYFGVPIPEATINPIIVNEKGEDVEYQRGLVWTLEQKQLLIESMYNNIEIGKFVFRKRTFQWVEKRVKQGKIANTAFMDLVDGKQRYTTLIEFFESKFPDLAGNYYSELSNEAQRKFTGYRQMTYVELDENTTDRDVLNVFLSMSKEHIEFVKSIKV
jgi:Protein of unknown function DUF262